MIFTVIVLTVVALLLVGLISVLGVSVFVFCRINNRRYNGNPNLKYFTAEDFPGLIAEPFFVPSDRGQMLHANLYRREEIPPKALLIFAHGFGAGHLAYTKEIDTLVRAGYWVLAHDATGCGESEGRCVRGFDQGVADLKCMIRFADGSSRFQGMKKILVGHSWGAFCVMNSSAENGIDGAVAVCGFISGAKVLAQITIGRKIPWLVFLEEFYLRILYRLRFGSGANYNSVKSLKKTDKPILLLYGTADRTVVFPGNGAVITDAVRGRKNIQFKIYEGRGHNPYLLPEAEREMHATFDAIAEQKKKNPALAREMYRQIDYPKITQEDPAFMREIVDFCDAVALPSGAEVR